MKTTHTRNTKTISLAALAFFAAGLSGSVAACEVKIGAVGPLSGPAAQWGQAIKGAADFVAAEANEAGGLQVGNEKCKVTVLAVDGKYSAEGAAAAGNNLVSEGVKFVLGPIGSPEVTGIKPIAARNNLLMMSDSFAKNAIGPQWPTVFHLGPGPSAWADPIIKVAKAKFNLTSVLMIGPNDQAGTDVADVAGKVYEKNGIKVGLEYYQRGTTNFAPVVTRILRAKPDAVDVASCPPGDAGTVIKQLRQAGFTGAIGRLGGPGTDEIMRATGGPEVIGDFYWYEPIFIDDKIREMGTRYKTLLKADPPSNNFFYQFSAGARMVLKAITAAGTATDTAKVAAALRAMPVDDPNLGKGLWIGQEFFGINQELSLPYGVGLIVKGKVQPVQRMAAATGK
ncbi:ABC transporter substrate-binding protein [Caballeronia sp. LZ065]|uniref:ABC transporter substrate-binding protein n=1 Tax=Caballeronia sp. LZ065 TaxID=3038571 RepID=UPI002862E69B|nr:ABC transporter substrate-binding protein [Caballeronia sp. LZ065]MDR5784625.1 ABC transporter substrate-binding protein [Caballeronia sp. LZ065]